MRGQSYICLLCRHAGRPLPSNGSARRNTSTRKGPYVLSRTVIDLDAMDSKFVKRYEEMEDAALRPVQNMKKVAPLWIDSRWTEQTEKASSRREDIKVFEDPVTGPDLLTYALIGTISKDSTYYPRLRQLFKAHQIQLLDTSEIKFKKLTHGFNTTQSIILEGDGFSPEETRNNKKRLEDCTIWATLHRMVSSLSSTTEGCKFLANNSEMLADSIKKCRRARTEHIMSQTSDHDVLLLLNNLTLNFGAKGIQIGPPLCNAGLYYAAKTDTLPAVSMYLNISIENKYTTNWHTVRALRWLGALFTKRKSLDNAAQKELRSQADLISTLMSGWATDNGPCSGQERQPSFADLVSHKYDGCPKAISFDPHSTYLLMLGEMGYGQILLHEWRRLGNPEPESSPISGHYISAMAFIMANNRREALAILQADSSADRSTRLEDKSECKDVHLNGEMTQYLFSRHYDMNKLMPATKLKEKILTPMPKDPREALKVIDGLLLTDLNLPIFNCGERHIVDLATFNGEEGLQIRDRTGVELYFKPMPQRQVWDLM